MPELHHIRTRIFPRPSPVPLRLLVLAVSLVGGLGLEGGCQGRSREQWDAQLQPDASPADATSATDSAFSMDAAVAPDATVSCSVEGVPGQCLHVDACEGSSTPGYCPGPVEIQCCTSALPVCDPAASPQPNTGLGEVSGLDGCPDGMIGVATFCIDQYEASLIEVHTDGTTSPWSPYKNPGSSRVRAVSLAGAVPQGYISGNQAAAACADAGNRLCTDSEWLRACQGSSIQTYPYGDTLQLGVCNDRRAVHPAVEYFGTSDSWIWSQLGHPCINQLANSIDPTGANVGCITPEGAYDMMGNLHEWTADPNGTFRGGFYVDTSFNGPGCLYATTAHNTEHWDYSTGFRCCADR